jgi:dephospho-CoA kinase
MLQHLGAYTIDADGLSHQAMSPGAPAYKPVIDTFGQFILNPDKSINRSLLGSIVFANPEALRKLEAITHPIVGQAINTLISRSRQPFVVIEAIKLLEGELGKGVDAVWVVDAKPQTQYARLIQKRKMSQEAAKQRILTQGAQGEKLKSANVVINNDGNIEDTWKQVQAAFNKLAKPAPPPAAPTAPAPARPAPPAAKPAAPPPAQAEAPADEAIPTVDVDTSGITVKRGMPSNAEEIAAYISKFTGKSIGKVDVMMAFGQKSYLLAADTSDATVGLIGWQVENLITCVDELYIGESPEAAKVVYALIRAIEEASQELQSEVSFIFLPAGTSDAITEPFLTSGYETTTVKNIKIPAWREAVQELLTEGQLILTKRLRKDRVLKPI